MATIKDGYGGQPLEIRVSTGDHEGKASIWIEMVNEYKHHTLGGDGEENMMHETLHYADIGELIALRDEINKAITELAGV